MLQLVYVSSANPRAPADPVRILAASRRNNHRDSITGLLYSDKSRFLQVLEGPEDKVEEAFARIQADPRHRAIVQLSRRTTDAREFGDWEMAHYTPGSDAEAFIERISMLAANAAPDVRGTFEGFVKARRAA
ncbi:MAG: BLUF domain-containing protein [Sphingomonadales bacterium]|nr:MAG: BLUF domain-containing protein [Sphingomonadales bacterium]